MELMREVLDNRLTAANASDALRSYVACNPVTNDMRGIVQANTCGRAHAPQFDGFDGARNAPNPAQLAVINSVLSQANDGTNLYFSKARAHIGEALEMASRPTKAAPITDSSLVFWRTQGAKAPSTYAQLKRTLGGQDFYSLSSNYLKNPQNPSKP